LELQNFEVLNHGKRDESRDYTHVKNWNIRHLK